MSLVLIIVIPLIAEAVDWCSEDLKCPHEVPQEHTMCMYKDETETSRCTEMVDLQNDTNRDLMVRLHNHYRRKIAMGEVPGWPAAANMRTLRYDMTLEKIAFRWASQCWPDHDRCRKTVNWSFVGQNIARDFSSAPKFVANPVNDVSEWWDEIRNTDPMIVDSFSLSRTSKAQFTQMIWATTEKVGCAMVAYKLTSNISCPYLRFTVCNYGPGGNIISRPIYERGPPCSKCPYGDCVCKISPMMKRKSGNIWTRTARTITNTVKSIFNPIREFYPPIFPQKRKTDRNLVGFGTREYWCSEELACKNEFPPEHTMCLYKNEVETSRCSTIVDVMTDCDREKILRSHNFYRRKIAMGEVPGWPPAANMRMLTYDKTLEEIAYRWATQCVEEHDKCRKTSEWWSVGQNIAREYGQTPRVRTNPEGDVEAWWDEVIYANPNIVDGFFVQTNIKTQPTGHFVQLVWAKSEKIGCAMVSYKIKRPSPYPYVRVTICNYGPGGNVITHPVYEKGLPCSRCPPNATCVCDFEEEAVLEACNQTDSSDFEGFTSPHFDYNVPVSPYSRTPMKAFAESFMASRSTVNLKWASRASTLHKTGETPFLETTMYRHRAVPKKGAKAKIMVPNEVLIPYPPQTQLEHYTNQPFVRPQSRRKYSIVKSFISFATHPFKNIVTSRTDLMHPTRNEEPVCLIYQGLQPPYVVAYERPVARFVSDLPFVQPAWIVVLSSPREDYRATIGLRGPEDFTPKVYFPGERSLSDSEGVEDLFFPNESLPNIGMNASGGMPQGSQDTADVGSTGKVKVDTGVTGIHHHLAAVSQSEDTEEAYKELVVVTGNDKHAEHSSQRPEEQRMPDDGVHPLKRTARKNDSHGMVTTIPSITIQILTYFAFRLVPYVIN